MRSLLDRITEPGAARSARFHAPGASMSVAELAGSSTLGPYLDALRGRSVLLATSSQLPTAIALLELDGVARRLVLCTPDLTPDDLAGVATLAEADAIIVDAVPGTAPPVETCVISSTPTPRGRHRVSDVATEWVLLTSGTTGIPKLVSHTFDSLGGTLPRQPSTDRCVWSTFYDIRRYGGLQIYLRAVLSGTSLVLSSHGESTRDFFSRGRAAGVTHISGTPTHWRRALMSGDATLLAPNYVRLSGEIADQALLDTLRKTYPHAQVSHAFASTEAGVAFDINDGMAGFPEALIGERGAVDMKVKDGTLHIRSRRIAAGYLGSGSPVTADDGYVDTGDLVELQADRYYFRGRRGGIVNVGGHKVFPEEVEAVLNSDSRVLMSLVHGRRNSITGAIVVAQVVLVEGMTAGAEEEIRNELLSLCRRELPPYKVPTSVRFVADLAVTAAGKLVRPVA